MVDQSLLGEILDKIELARRERRRALRENAIAVKKLRSDVQRKQSAVRRQLQQDARAIRRSLERFVQRNRASTRRLLSSAHAARSRYSMRLRFDNTSATGQRKRVVQSILRASASRRRLGELHRRRITATKLASLYALASSFN
jgi:hypothetical protein